MEGLLLAAVSSVRLALGYLCGYLLAIPQRLRHAPGLPALPGVILAGALAVVSWRGKRRHTSRSVQAPGKERPGRSEAPRRCCENTGPVTEVDSALQPPGVEASPPLLQTLCLRTLNGHLSRLADLQDMLGLLRTLRGGRPRQPRRGTGAKPASRASGTDGNRLRSVADGENTRPGHPERPGRPQGAVTGRKQDVQGTEEEKRRDVGAGQVPRDRAGPSGAAAGYPPTTVAELASPGIGAAPVRPPLRRQREAESGDRLVRGLTVDLSGVSQDRDPNVSPQTADEKHRNKDRRLREPQEVTEAPAAETAGPQPEKAPARRENAKLRDEVGRPKLQPRLPPRAQEDQPAGPQGKLPETEARGSEAERNRFHGWGGKSSADPTQNRYQKMVQDMTWELQRRSFYYEDVIRHYRRRAEDAWRAATFAESQCRDLRRERDRLRHMLAWVRPWPPPWPGGPFAPAAPPAAHRGPEGPGCPLRHLAPRKDAGHTVRDKKRRVTFKLDEGPRAAGP